jgi:ATP-dependent DNA ligase
MQLYAFHILAMGGDDLRSLPLHMRKTNLEQLLARTVAPFERSEIGPTCFAQRAAWVWRPGFQASRSAVPWRPAEALDQGGEPEPSCDGA